MCSQPHASITGSPKATTSQPQAWSWPLSAVQPGSPGPPRRGRLQVGGRGQEGWDLEKGCAPRPPQFPRQRPCLRRSPKTKMFLPDGSLDLARVDTSLRIEDLWEQRQSGQPRGQPGPDRPTTSGPAPLPRGLTIGSGPPRLHWSGRRRPPPPARWGPAAASSLTPPAPSCQLQPQRGPSPGPAEDPQGPWPGRPPSLRAAPPAAKPARSTPPAALRRVRDDRRLPQERRLPQRGRRAAVRRPPGQPCVGRRWREREPPGRSARWRPLPADRRSSTRPRSPPGWPLPLRERWVGPNESGGSQMD